MQIFNGRNTTGTGSPSYAVSAGDGSRDEAKVLGVWNAGGFITPAVSAAARYNWYYLASSEGAGELNFLYASTEEAPVGFLGIGKRRFAVQDNLVLGGVLVDFIVDPKHRSVLPALTLQRQAQARALRDGRVALIYGLPNKKAEPLLRRLNPLVQDELVVHCRVVRAGRYLGRHLPAPLARLVALTADTLNALLTRIQLTPSRTVGEWSSGFGDDFDRLWQAFDKSLLCLGVRDSKFLRWRFAEQPGHTYHVFTVRRSSSNELRTYFVCEADEYALTVKDCLSVGSETELKHALLLLTLAARRRGADVVRFETAPWPALRAALRRAQFVVRSQRPLLGFISDTWRNTLDGATWYVTQADEDV